MSIRTVQTRKGLVRQVTTVLSGDRVFGGIIAIAYSLFVLTPFAFLFFSAFKTTPQIISSPLSPPTELNLSNFETLWSRTDFGLYYLNSAVVVTIGLAGLTFAATLTAYGLSRFHFRGREVITGVILAALLLPPALVVIPLFQQMQSYGLNNTRLGLGVAYVAFAMPLSVFILRAFFLRIPKELSDAARVDGAGEWSVFRRVMLPMASPAVFTILLIHFQVFWNEFVMALVLVQRSELRTIPVGLTLLSSEFVTDFGASAAGVLLGFIPMVIVFLVFSERMIKGIAGGGVKG